MWSTEPVPLAANARSMTVGFEPPAGQNATAAAMIATNAAAKASRAGGVDRPPGDTGVGDDAAPVARAGVGRVQQVELVGDVGHVLTSSKVFSRLVRAACKVADTVPTAMPRASAIPA